MNPYLVAFSFVNYTPRYHSSYNKMRGGSDPAPTLAQHVTAQVPLLSLNKSNYFHRKQYASLEDCDSRTLA